MTPPSTERQGRGYPRMLALLELLAESEDPLTVGDVASVIDIPKSTAWLLMQHLFDRHYLTDVGGHAYSAGPALYRLGAAVMNRQPIRTVARPHLEALRRKLDTNIYLAARVEDDVVYIDRLEQAQTPSPYAPLTLPRQLHCTAAGKVILAVSDDDLLERFTATSSPLPAATAESITDVHRLRQEIELTRSRGYAITDGEQYEGVLSIGAPIEQGGKLAAVVVASGYAPTMRAELDERVKAVLAAAASISSEL